jgi:3-methyladenine DNA glycosylase AlkD
VSTLGVIVDEALIALRATARTPSDHPASGGWGTRMERLGLTTDECLSIAKEVQRHCGPLAPRDVVAVALALVESRVFDARQVAYNLLRLHAAAARSLRAADLGLLGRGMDNWVSVDSFGCWVSGPAWRDGRIDDARVHRWAGSPDRWWRRAALVSTIPLNLASKGGHGDLPRTLAVCDLLAADHDEMVEKALSWALRELAKREPDAVRRFLSRRVTDIGARVRREVTNKLETGHKHPYGPQPGQRRPAPRRPSR